MDLTGELRKGVSSFNSKEITMERWYKEKNKKTFFTLFIFTLARGNRFSILAIFL